MEVQPRPLCQRGKNIYFKGCGGGNHGCRSGFPSVGDGGKAFVLLVLMADASRTSLSDFSVKPGISESASAQF
uniref:Uncharacterized protein n=1 Tax=Oryza meridionalis TaxID=40149 RepID=A0A0E0F8R2_9ORYZ